MNWNVCLRIATPVPVLFILVPSSLVLFTMGVVKYVQLLPEIHSPADLHKLSDEQLQALTQEIRDELIRVLTTRPAHFASNLLVVDQGKSRTP